MFGKKPFFVAERFLTYEEAKVHRTMLDSRIDITKNGHNFVIRTITLRDDLRVSWIIWAINDDGKERLVAYSTKSWKRHVDAENDAYKYLDEIANNLKLI